MLKKNQFGETEAYLIFDDTVINKKYGYNIELTRRQYSGNEHQVVCVLSAAEFVGLGIVNCVYFNRGMNNYGLQIIGFMTQILTRKQKQKSVEEMIFNAINNKKIPLKTVLMDSWYATQRLMGLIDNDRKIYYCPLKSHRGG